MLWNLFRKQAQAPAPMTTATIDKICSKINFDRITGAGYSIDQHGNMEVQVYRDYDNCILNVSHAGRDLADEINRRVVQHQQNKTTAERQAQQERVNKYQNSPYRIHWQTVEDKTATGELTENGVVIGTITVGYTASESVPHRSRITLTMSPTISYEMVITSWLPLTEAMQEACYSIDELLNGCELVDRQISGTI